MADARARTGPHPQAFVGDGHAPIGTDFEQGAAAPDLGPPGAARDRAQDAALVALGGARGGAGRAESRWRIRGWCWLRRQRAPVGGPASIDAGVRFCPGPGACARSARRRRKRGGRPRVGSARRGVRPVRSVVAAGGAQRPGRCVRTGGGAQIVAVEFADQMRPETMGGLAIMFLKAAGCESRDGIARARPGMSAFARTLVQVCSHTVRL